MISFQILGIAIILGILIIQRLLKTRSVKKGEVVIYDTNSTKGKIYSLITRIKTLQLIILLIITVIGSVITRNYRILKNIRAISESGQFELAHSLIQESKNGLIPLLFSRNLNYQNNLNWAISSIDNEEWNDAVVSLNNLIEQDSIPLSFIGEALIAYSKSFRTTLKTKYFNQNDYTYDYHWNLDDYFTEFSLDTTVNTLSITSYKTQLKRDSIPENTIENSYFLFNELSKFSDVKSLYILSSVTRDFNTVSLLLRMEDEYWINEFLKDYSASPEIVYNHNLKSFSRRQYNFTKDIEEGHNEDITVAVVELEQKLLEMCNDRNIITAQTVKRGMVDLPSKLLYAPFRRGVSTYSPDPSYYINYKYNRQHAYWIIDNMTSENFWTSLKIMLHCPEEFYDSMISSKRFETIIKSIELTSDQHGHLNFHLVLAAERFRDDSQNLEAIRLFEFVIYLSQKFPREWMGNMESDMYNRIADCKWNIKPYGPKMGYCDDLRKAMELSNDDWYATKYFSKCK